MSSNKPHPFTQDRSYSADQCDVVPSEVQSHQASNGGSRSSAGERCFHTADVAGSIPAATTTHKGDVAELMAAAELLRRGYRVSRPLSNGIPYDLIVDDGQKLFKVQVKKASPTAGGFRINLCSSKHHRGRERVLYTDTCDAVVAVDCDGNRFFVFFGPELQIGEIRLRIDAPRNNQKLKLNLHSHYELSRLFP